MIAVRAVQDTVRAHLFYQSRDMKEVRYFYVPHAAEMHELPEEEAQHAIRVLRMEAGDEMMLMDGEGTFYKAVVAEANKKHCFYNVVDALPQKRLWEPHIHVAMAPTKNIDRTEWFAEKATEIGVDEFSFIRSRWSERTIIKTERIDKIVVSAMKQSRKAWKPLVNSMETFASFVKRMAEMKSANGEEVQKFICHCHDDEPSLAAKAELIDCMVKGADAVVMIGPEGDFSIDEVRMAVDNGFKSMSLGKSRLRTETAALAAVHIMSLSNR